MSTPIDWDERQFAAEGGYDRHGECRDKPSPYDPPPTPAEEDE